MENEIKVGEWVRTKDGRIYQVDSSKDEWALSDIFYKVIVKHSPNLIDLIQCGDYVNGKEVKHIADFEGVKEPIRKVIFVDETHLIPGETAENEDIKSIVTKEMMESITYKVKQEENKKNVLILNKNKKLLRIF